MKAALSALALVSLIAVGCESSRDRDRDRDDEREVKIDRSDAPSAVLRGFERRYPDATIRDIERETDRNGNVEYEIKYKDRDGDKKKVTLDERGNKIGKDD